MHKEYNMYVVEEHYGNWKYKCGHCEETFVLPLPVMFINNMRFLFFVRQKFSQTLCTLIVVRRSFFSAYALCICSVNQKNLGQIVIICTLDTVFPHIVAAATILF